MIDEHMCARFRFVVAGAGDRDPRRWDETVVVPIAMETWGDLRASLPQGGDDAALHRAAFERLRPRLLGVPSTVQFYKVTRYVIETAIGPIASDQKKSQPSPVYWLGGHGPLDADALGALMPRATHAIDHLRETHGRVIIVHGLLHHFGPHDRRVDWEEARAPAEPSHRLLTVEGGFHPPVGAAGRE